MQCTIRRIATVLLLLMLAHTAFAQRSTVPPAGASQSIDRLPRPEDNSVALVVHVVYANEQPAGERINVRVDSVNGGTVGEDFTNAEGKATFGVPVGAYVVRIRGRNTKSADSGTVNIESFEKLHHVYIHAQLISDGTSEPGGEVSAIELKVPKSARKEFDRGNVALAKGDRDKAIQHLNKAVELYPQFAMAYNNLAALYMQSKDVAQAREALNKALQAEPDLAFTHANIIRLKLLDRNYGGAIADAEKALAKQPASPEFLFLMCEAQLFSGEYEQALLYARKVFAAPHQKFEKAHIFAGRALEAQNHPDEAKAEYHALLMDEPTPAEATEARNSIARLESAAKEQ